MKGVMVRDKHRLFTGFTGALQLHGLSNSSPFIGSTLNFWKVTQRNRVDSVSDVRPVVVDSGIFPSEIRNVFANNMFPKI